MESDEKPFVCSSHGCGQRFANNDHLESHKQKHQLSLKLPGIGNIKNNDILLAGRGLDDQTPTPTRFLENLEKEGLFQDLESNPFDQATPAVNTTTNSTPHDSVIIINTTNNSNSSKAEQPALTTVPVHSTPATTTKLPPALTLPPPKVLTKSAPVSVLVRVSVPHHIPTVIPAAIANANMHVPSALPVPGHLARTIAQPSMPISIPTPAIVSSPITSHPPPYSNAKQRLKEQLRQQHNNNNAIHPENIISQAMTEAVDMVTSEHHNGLSSHIQLAQHINGGHWDDDDDDDDDDGHHKDKKRPRRSQEELDPDERRRKFLERNRAAATRCREKRKIWVQQLEKKADDLNDTNSHLQGEISLLKAEVAQLKSLLLAHKDCPVTLAQHKMASQGQLDQGHAGHVQVTDTPNGLAVTVSHSDVTAEDVATSALTQMAQRVVIENYGGQATNWPQHSE
ncbi:hypothetical protein QZH41_015722 [Actinostola sp. cb2023]|nr:hypothetical protein QZH41_015722 [Actinostola sp. cb2023]